MNPVWVCSRPSASILWLHFLVFLWNFQQWGWDVSLTILSALGTFFFLLDCLVQLQYVGLCPVLFYHVRPFLIIIPMWSALFSKWKQRKSGSGGEGNGRSERDWEGGR